MSLNNGRIKKLYTQLEHCMRERQVEPARRVLYDLLEEAPVTDAFREHIAENVMGFYEQGLLPAEHILPSIPGNPYGSERGIFDTENAEWVEKRAFTTFHHQIETRMSRDFMLRWLGELQKKYNK